MPCGRRRLTRTISDARYQAASGEELLLCRDQHRGVDRQERLATPHHLPGGGNVQSFHEAVHLGHHVDHVLLRRLDGADGAHGLLEGLARHGGVDHPERPLLGRSEMHRLPDRPGGIHRALGPAREHSRMLFGRHLGHATALGRTTARRDEEEEEAVPAFESEIIGHLQPCR